MFQMLQHCLVKGSDEDEDGAKDLVDLVLKKMDEDRDGRVSEADYATAVAKDSLLLEAFGQCLPSPKVCPEVECGFKCKGYLCVLAVAHSQCGSSR
jgi:hypothetical protein